MRIAERPCSDGRGAPGPPQKQIEHYHVTVDRGRLELLDVSKRATHLELGVHRGEPPTDHCAVVNHHYPWPVRTGHGAVIGPTRVTEVPRPGAEAMVTVTPSSSSDRCTCIPNPKPSGCFA